MLTCSTLDSESWNPPVSLLQASVGSAAFPAALSNDSKASRAPVGSNPAEHEALTLTNLAYIVYNISIYNYIYVRLYTTV